MVQKDKLVILTLIALLYIILKLDNRISGRD